MVSETDLGQGAGSQHTAANWWYTALSECTADHTPPRLTQIAQCEGEDTDARGSWLPSHSGSSHCCLWSGEQSAWPHTGDRPCCSVPTKMWPCVRGQWSCSQWQLWLKLYAYKLLHISDNKANSWNDLLHFFSHLTIILCCALNSYGWSRRRQFGKCLYVFATRSIDRAQLGWALGLLTNKRMSPHIVYLIW